MGNKHICLPFASEAQYRDYVDYPTEYRQYLTGMLAQHPELFPKDMDPGFPFHACYVSVKRWVGFLEGTNSITQDCILQKRFQRFPIDDIG